jgi:hypothetical protein
MCIFELAFGLISTDVAGDLNLIPATNNEEKQSSLSKHMTDCKCTDML